MNRGGTAGGGEAADGRVVEARLPTVTELAVGGIKRITQSPTALTFVALWIFGLFCMLYASAPVGITEEMREDFDRKMAEAGSVEGYEEALSEIKAARVYELQAQESEVGSRLVELEHQREELRREAFSIVGLFSEMGVQEARQLFWDCLEKGKGFARRSTFYDMFFSVAMHRDEEFSSFVIRVILNFVINATLGMIGVIVAFLYYLYVMVITYKASLFSGLTFFLIAGLAGLSMAALYMFILYGILAGGAYSIIRVAVENNRIRGRNAPGHRPIRYGRPHMD